MSAAVLLAIDYKTAKCIATHQGSVPSAQTLLGPSAHYAILYHRLTQALGIQNCMLCMISNSYCTSTILHLNQVRCIPRLTMTVLSAHEISEKSMNKLPYQRYKIPIAVIDRQKYDKCDIIAFQYQ